MIIFTPIQYAAAGVVLLFALSPCAAFLPPRATSARFIYLACALLCAALAALGLSVLVSTATPGSHLVLPIGLPFARSELGLDALSAVFFVIANLTSAIVSAGAMGYGAHAHEPRRVLPFYPAFIAAMNLVLLAQDAFSFLLGWELMSLASWALVVSEDRSAEQPTRRPRLSHHGELPGHSRCCSHSVCSRHHRAATASIRCVPPSAVRAHGDRAAAGLDRRRLQGGPGPAARMAAARASGRAQPRVGADERRHDQGRGVRLRAYRVRPRRAAAPGGGAFRCC